MSHRELPNPYVFSGEGPALRGWTLLAAVAGAAAAMAAGAGTAHAATDDGFGGDGPGSTGGTSGSGDLFGGASGADRAGSFTVDGVDGVASVSLPSMSAPPASPEPTLKLAGSPRPEPVDSGPGPVRSPAAALPALEPAAGLPVLAPLPAPPDPRPGATGLAAPRAALPEATAPVSVPTLLAGADLVRPVPPSGEPVRSVPPPVGAVPEPVASATPRPEPVSVVPVGSTPAGPEPEQVRPVLPSSPETGSAPRAGAESVVDRPDQPSPPAAGVPVTLTPFDPADAEASLTGTERALAEGEIGLTDRRTTEALDDLFFPDATDTATRPEIGTTVSGTSSTVAPHAAEGASRADGTESPTSGAGSANQRWAGQEVTTTQEARSAPAVPTVTSSATSATAGAPGAADPDGETDPAEAGAGEEADNGVQGGNSSLPWWALDQNNTGAHSLPFPPRATGLHPEAFRAPAQLGDLLTPRSPEEILNDERQGRRMQRQDRLFELRRDMGVLLGVPPIPTPQEDFIQQLEAGLLDGEQEDAAAASGSTAPISQGAVRSAAQLYDVWQRRYATDILQDPERMSLAGLSPLAMEAYLCLGAVRCEGAPPEATISAGAAIANLLGSNDEMTPEALEEVLAAARRGMQDLDTADGIAARFLPDARHSILFDPVRDELISEINRIASPTVADLLAARFLPEAHAAGPDGTPRTDPLPGSPVGLGTLGVSGSQLRGLRGGTLPPVETAALAAALDAMEEFVHQERFQIPGSSAAPSELPSAQRQADRRTLEAALSEYWSIWRAEPESIETTFAWADVENARTRLIQSMRGTTEPDVLVDDELSIPDQPSEVAQLTARAQTDVLETLLRNLPNPATQDGTPLTLADFTAALLGPNRMAANDFTFPLPGAELPGVSGGEAQGPSEVSARLTPSGRRAPVPTPTPTPTPTEADEQGADPREASEGQTPSQPAAGRGSSVGGVTVGGDVGRPVSREEAVEAMFPGGDPNRADPPTVVEGGLTPQPDDRTRFDPNTPPDRVPVLPEHTESFPGRDEELERVLHGNARGVPGLFTSPLGQEEASVRPTGEGADPVRPGDGSTTTAAAAEQPPRYAPLPDGRQGIVVREVPLAGTGGANSRAGSVVTVQDLQTGEQFASVQGTQVQNPDGTTDVYIPQPGVGSVRVGYNPTGTTSAVYRLAPGQTGRVTPTTPVQRVRVRTAPAPVLEFNGGGGPNASRGGADREPVAGNPTVERWRIRPASTLDPDTGVRTYSAQVPDGYQDRVDLTGGGEIVLVVPAGTRPAVLSATEQAFVPYVPTPLPGYSPSPALSPNRATNPTPRVSNPVPSSPRANPRPVTRPQPAARPAPQPSPAGTQPEPTWQERAGQVGGAVWNVITTPHPLDPVRGSLREVWRYVPGFPVPGQQREFGF